MDDFDGLADLVTGAGSGIDAAVPTGLQHRGAAVAGLDRDTGGVPEGVLAVEVDGRDGAAVRAAVDEVAWAVAYLAWPRSSSTTGTILAVDGGFHGLRVRPPAPR